MKKWFSGLIALVMLMGLNSGLAETVELKDADKKTVWSATDTQITLSAGGIAVNGDGAEASGSVVTITKKGTYVVTGTLADGQIVIDAPDTDKVHLVLNGVDITNASGAAIDGKMCDKLIITLAEGTSNVLTDGGANFAYRDETEEEPNAALFSKNDLTLNGLGSLTVNGGFKNGIGSKDDLLIVSGNITVNAANNALRGNDSVTIVNGTITLTAGNDGIQTNNTEDADKGFVKIVSGDVQINATHDGIAADKAVTVLGGSVNITAGGGIANTAGINSTDSMKGIKSDGSIAISGGVVTINSADDSIHAAGIITLSGGELTLATLDDGVHSDSDLVITGGKVTVTQSYEGLEAAHITISGGAITLTSSDDGINAAGGADQSGFGGGMGGGFRRDNFAAGDYDITITGGEISLYAGGDGLDSNGTITISGGTLVSIIRSTADNGAIDSDGTLTITGGKVIYGGTGIGNTPTGSSTQSYVYVGQTVKAGQTISVKQNGQTLAAFLPTVDCAYLAFSTPEITSGQSYEVYQDETLLATAVAGSGGGGFGFGGFGGGGGRQRPSNEGTAVEPPQGSQGQGGFGNKR